MGAPALMEPTLKYQPDVIAVLTAFHHLEPGPCMVGSLTGAVSSQSVTEELEGSLSAVGHRAGRARAQASLTARLTSRAGTKVGPSDPVVLNGRAIAQRTKGTPGITG